MYLDAQLGPIGKGNYFKFIILNVIVVTLFLATRLDMARNYSISEHRYPLWLEFDRLHRTQYFISDGGQYW